jgi:aerobic carbon-monoxide dehydrogenase large subunit
LTEVSQPRYLGARVKRVEDPRFLLGRGRYIDDLVLPGMLHATFVRSTIAHARIEGIEASPARALPGVAAVLTGSDIATRAKPIVCDSAYPDWQSSGMPAMAADRVRFVGEALAVIAAESRYVAEDAERLIEVSYDPLPTVVAIEEATREGAPLLHEGWRDNYFTRVHVSGGDPAGAFDHAYGTLEFKVATHRHSGIPLECRGVIADYDAASGMLTMWSSTQVPHIVRSGLATCLGLPENRVRVIAPDVGGGFGSKAHLNPEEIAVALLAVEVGRPVKWIEDRREHMLACFHSREHYHHVRVAYDAQGRITGLAVQVYVDAGAYSVYPWTAAMDPAMAAYIMPGPYRIENFECDAYGIATNKTPFGAYRGVTRPATCFSVERAIDQVARALDMDRVELRRRNLVRAEDFPYTSVTGMVYDSASLIESLDKVVDQARYREMLARQEKARSEGRYLGVGIATYIEQTAPPGDEGFPMTFKWESAIVRMDPSGSVTVHLATHSHGQGHETTMAQIVADQLAIPMERIRIFYGDTMTSPQGLGSFASRSAVLAGGAAHIAAGRVRDKVIEHAAHLLEVDPADVLLVNGGAQPRGVPDRTVDVSIIARLAYDHPEKFPPGMDPLLEATATFDGGLGTYANCAQIALIELDPETGRVEILEYHIVEDCGQQINPMIVEGQVHGGIAQGIGGALYEELIYDSSGQLLTTTLMDYLLPGSTDIPTLTVSHLETPSSFTPNGIKGMGEGGAIAPYAVMAAAVEDALRPIGNVIVNEVPLTPGRVRALVEQAKLVGPRSGNVSSRMAP